MKNVMESVDRKELNKEYCFYIVILITLNSKNESKV